MKTVIGMYLFALIAQSSAFAESGMYGWDVKCVGKDHLVVLASQSDDDFYITIQSNKIPKMRFWIDNGPYDSSLKTVMFVTAEGMSDKNNAGLVMNRANTNGFGFASGVLALDSDRYDVNCFVRYGKDEEDFDKVSKLPFPRIALPE